MEQKRPKDSDESVKHRNKLLEYDRNRYKNDSKIDENDVRINRNRNLTSFCLLAREERR